MTIAAPTQIKPQTGQLTETAKAILASLNLGPTVCLPTEGDSEEELELERKKVRRSYCHRHGIRVKAKDGHWKRIMYRCGLWRGRFCEQCYQDRLRQIKEQYLYARAQCEQPTAVLADKNQATKFVRKLRDADVEYRRYPTEEGDIVLFDGAAFEHDEQEIPLDDLDFDAIADTPEGRRFSGSLGNQPASASDDGETISVRVEMVIADPGEGHTLSEAWHEATKRTKHLNPGFDKNELEDALNRRTQAYKDVLIEQGGIIHFVSRGYDTVSSNSYDGWDYNELNDENDWILDLPMDVPSPQGQDEG